MHVVYKMTGVVGMVHSRVFNCREFDLAVLHSLLGISDETSGHDYRNLTGLICEFGMVIKSVGKR
jgi:hypothetical protein